MVMPVTVVTVMMKQQESIGREQWKGEVRDGSHNHKPHDILAYPTVAASSSRSNSGAPPTSGDLYNERAKLKKEKLVGHTSLETLLDMLIEK